MDFLKRKKKDEPKETNFGTMQASPEPPRKPTALEILKSRRAQKMETVKRLDREIAQLDHDITYVERYPQNERVLEFIAARFEDEAHWKDKASHA